MRRGEGTASIAWSILESFDGERVVLSPKAEFSGQAMSWRSVVGAMTLRAATGFGPLRQVVWPAVKLHVCHACTLAGTQHEAGDGNA
jgi:hypothetical protein